jgi:hypothetical protein
MENTQAEEYCLAVEVSDPEHPMNNKLVRREIGKVFALRQAAGTIVVHTPCHLGKKCNAATTTGTYILFERLYIIVVFNFGSLYFIVYFPGVGRRGTAGFNNFALYSGIGSGGDKVKNAIRQVTDTALTRMSIPTQQQKKQRQKKFD